ncbi:hypothetical protein LSTR_LSTR003901 [Laodelphax striatellus]|uniref:Uncharacterized protein n=1 Tax=Laodelphax striatellus TaxID=195883 RepID=A0A482X958_LAOST|nr:hypothetical protein LSTR_LSTR003901 [Laodelphax striatellus]
MRVDDFVFHHIIAIEGAMKLAMAKVVDDKTEKTDPDKDKTDADETKKTDPDKDKTTRLLQTIALQSIKNCWYARLCKLPQENDALITECSKWLVENNSSTFHPPKSQMVNSLLKKNGDVNFSTWQKYPVEVRDFYETHEKVEVKARKACETSNLDTSDEEEMREPRFLRRRDLSQELEFLEEPSRNGAKIPPNPNFKEVNFQELT